jgi:hypothetical protein
LFEHDLIRKPASTFRDHAPARPPIEQKPPARPLREWPDERLA